MHVPSGRHKICPDFQGVVTNGVKMTAILDESTKKQTIAHHNDLFRRSLSDSSATFELFVTGILGSKVLTPMVANLPHEKQIELFRKIAFFTNFDPENDPHGERDFEAVDLDGEKYFWKIDLYALEMMHGSEDPLDLTKTRRVLTIMHCSEY